MNSHGTVALAATVLLVTAFAMSFSARAETPPSAAWRMDADKGKTAKDSSGNGNDAVLKGAAWMALEGRTFLSFDGRNSRAVAPNSPALQLRSAFTIEAWVRPLAGRHQTIVCKGEQDGPGHYWLYLSPRSLSFEVSDGRRNNFKESFSDTMPQGKWSHVALTFDQGAVQGYVNGKTSGRLEFKVKDIGVCNEPLVIGAYSEGRHPYNGLMSNLRITPAALAREEIARHYQTERAEHPNVPTALDKYVADYCRVGRRLAEFRYEFVVIMDGIRYGLEHFDPKGDAGQPKWPAKLGELEGAFKAVYDPLAQKFAGLPLQPDPPEVAGCAARLDALDKEIQAALKAAEDLRTRLAALRAEAAPILERTPPAIPPRAPGWDRNIFPRVMSCGRPNWPAANMEYFLSALRHLHITLFQDDYSGRKDDLKQRFLQADERYGVPFVDAKTAGNAEWVDYLDRDRAKMKQMLAEEFGAFGRFQGFAGVEIDEPSAGDDTAGLDVDSDATAAAFREYLRQKFGPARLAGLGIADLSAVRPPHMEDRKTNQVLWTEWQLCKIKLMTSFFADLEKLMRQTRPDLVQLMVIQKFLPGAPQQASYPALAGVVDNIAIDIYSSGDISEAFMLDLLRSGARGHAMLCVGTCYDKTTRDYARDVAIPLAHGTGLWIWCWEYQTRVPLPPLVWQPPTGERLWTWKEGMWEASEAICSDIVKLEPYLVNTVPAAPTALLYSERTGIIGSGGPGAMKGSKYFDDQLGLYATLVRSHIPFTPLFTEVLTKERLAPLKVAIAANTRALAPAECSLLREWVRDGGCLVATAGTSRLDEWGRPQKDYGLADVFGASYRESIAKPAQLGAKRESLPALPADARCASHDVVEIKQARVPAKWDDGSPAILLNQFGKGRCFLLTATDSMGQSDAAREKDEAAPVAIVLAGLADAALVTAGEPPLVKVLSCPAHVEVNVRAQPEKRRLMVHLLNWSREAEPISGVRLALRLPADAKNVRAFYPSDNAQADARLEERALTITLRESDIHDLLVVEY